MRKILMGGLVVVSLALLVVGGVLALPTNKGIDKAKKVSPAINEEGNVVAPPSFVSPPFPQLAEKDLQKVVFIRYAPGKESLCDNDWVCEPRENWKNCPNDCPKGGEEPTPTPEETTCYDFIAGSRPRWNWVEDYYYSTVILETSSAGATKTWDGVTSATIFGNGISEALDWGVYDYKNSVSFGNYSEAGVLAVTAIWFRGKDIYEYDIMFDEDYTFGDASVDSTIFDLNTVTLHEFGHGAGLNDLYDVACINNVMYGRLGEGEVKTTLGNGDITGIQNLYGM